MRNRFAMAAGLAVLSSSPAFAQDGALWRDDEGRQMSVDFSGGGAPPPMSAEWSAADMAAFFDKMCLQTGGARLAVQATAIEAAMADKSYELPMGKNQPPLPLVIARGDGVVVAQADKFLDNTRRQCNVIFYLSNEVVIADAEGALAAVITRPADNSADRVKKNGKPNRYFSPEWIVPAMAPASGSSTATVSTLPFGGSGRSGFQFSLLANPEERK